MSTPGLHWFCKYDPYSVGVGLAARICKIKPKQLLIEPERTLPCTSFKRHSTIRRHINKPDQRPSSVNISTARKDSSHAV